MNKSTLDDHHRKGEDEPHEEEEVDSRQTIEAIIEEIGTLKVTRLHEQGVNVAGLLSLITFDSETDLS